MDAFLFKHSQFGYIGNARFNSNFGLWKQNTRCFYISVNKHQRATQCRGPSLLLPRILLRTKFTTRNQMKIKRKSAILTHFTLRHWIWIFLPIIIAIRSAKYDFAKWNQTNQLSDGTFWYAINLKFDGLIKWTFVPTIDCIQHHRLRINGRT